MCEYDDNIGLIKNLFASDLFLFGDQFVLLDVVYS